MTRFIHLAAMVVLLGCATGTEGGPDTDGNSDGTTDVGQDTGDTFSEPDQADLPWDHGADDGIADTGTDDPEEDDPDAWDGVGDPDAPDAWDAAGDTVTDDPEAEGVPCGSTTCAPGEECCSGVCSDTQTDMLNCGGCGVVCDPLRSDNCSGGDCMCYSVHECTGASTVRCCGIGLCVDTETSDEHCGDCWHGCPPGQYCSYGECDF